MMELKIKGFLKVSSVFYIRKGSRIFEEVKGKKINFKGFENFDFFAHKVKKGKLVFWVISESISGCRISKLNKSLKKLIDKTDSSLNERGADRLEFLIKEKVDHEFISPSFRFIVNPNKIIYVATKKNNTEKYIFPRRYEVHVQE